MTWNLFDSALRRALAPAAGVAAWLAATATWAQQPQQPYYWHGPGWHDGWFGMIFGPLMMLVFIGLAAAVVVLVVRWIGGGSGGGLPGSNQALSVLEERFARGEIDKAEFEERRRALEKR